MCGFTIMCFFFRAYAHNFQLQEKLLKTIACTVYFHTVIFQNFFQLKSYIRKTDKNKRNKLENLRKNDFVLIQKLKIIEI